MSAMSENFVMNTDSNTGVRYTQKAFKDIIPFNSSREDVIAFLEQYSIGRLDTNMPFNYTTYVNGMNGDGENTQSVSQSQDSDIYIVPMYSPNNYMNNLDLQLSQYDGTSQISTVYNYYPISANDYINNYPSQSVFDDWHLMEYNINNIMAFPQFLYMKEGTLWGAYADQNEQISEYIDYFKNDTHKMPVANLLAFYTWTGSQWVENRKIIFACISLHHVDYINKTNTPYLPFQEKKPNYTCIAIRNLFFDNTSTTSYHYGRALIPTCSAFKKIGNVATVSINSGYYSVNGAYGKIERFPKLLRTIEDNQTFKDNFSKFDTNFSVGNMWSNTTSSILFQHMQGTGLYCYSSNEYWYNVLNKLYMPIVNNQSNIPTTNTLQAKIDNGYISFPKIDKNGSHDLVHGNDISTLPYLQNNPEGDITLGGGHNPQKINTDSIENVTNVGILSNVPNLSTIGVFNTSYAISQNELQQFANYVWNTDDTTFDELVENLKMFNNPLDAIIGIRLYPFDVTSVGKGVALADTHIYLGRTETDINARRLLPNWYAKIPMGELTYNGNDIFTDYEPYTKATLKLPYIGTMELPSCYYVDKTIKIEYIIDITTGACTCQVYSNGTLFASMDGVCGIDIPISTVDRQNYAFEKANNKIGTIEQLGNALGNAMAGNIGGAIGGMVASGLNEMRGNMIKADINKTSASTPTCSLWTPQKCYLILEKTRTQIPSTYGHNVGYVCNESFRLSELSGYTTCINPHLDDIVCTEYERNLLNNLLISGIIL